MLASGEGGRSRGKAWVAEMTCEESASDEGFTSAASSSESSSSSSMRKASGVSGSMGLVTVESEVEVSSCGRQCSSDISMCVIEGSAIDQ
jgi:hypothetical protein